MRTALFRLGLRAGGCLLVTLLSWVTLSASAKDWEPEIRAFEEADRKSGVGKVDAMFYGSSSFRMWTNMVAAFPGVRVLNRGFGGSELSDLIRYADRVVLPHAPPVLVIYGGDNDLAGGKSAARVAEDFATLMEWVRRKLPRTRVLFAAVKPSPSRETLLEVQQDANARVRRQAKWDRQVEYVDVATPLLESKGRPDPRFFVGDRLHLNEEGYDVWRRELNWPIRRALRK